MRNFGTFRYFLATSSEKGDSVKVESETDSIILDEQRKSTTRIINDNHKAIRSQLLNQCTENLPLFSLTISKSFSL